MRIYIRNKSQDDQRLVLTPIGGASVTVPNEPTNITMSKLTDGSTALCLGPLTYPTIPLIEHLSEEVG